MENALAGSGVGLRAHAKAHKCSEIARRQIAAGAVGICCQKVSEAIVMAEGGVSDILITNQIVDPVKLQRLCSIGASVNLSFLCDSSEVISTLSAVAVSEEVTLNILVEINVGANRCGVDAGKPAALLASKIDRTPGLTFAGLQAYHGSAQHLVSAKDRQSRVLDTIEKVQHSKTELAKLGLDREWITGSGTGSFPFERDSGVFSAAQS